ncbi:hypothetical protein SORBI_3005G041450 [Sorghum bicolor]|uniref:Uncharacterized protein n=1 Tax=Sorghum bicolor TaxID=4558 RepID=A0A1Z5RH87_SORBI|nr:hypothetical protein SORBI_3005G041450 [Sorghum bicolor]
MMQCKRLVYSMAWQWHRMDALHQCKLHERDKKSVYIYTPVLLWFLHGIGTNNGGHHVAIMAKCSLTHITCPRKPLNHPSEFCSGSYKLYWGKKKGEQKATPARLKAA